MIDTGTILKGHFAEGYVLEKQLGSGGEGSVYTIKDPQSPGYQRVAKVYHVDRPNIAARLPELEKKLGYMATVQRFNFISRETGNCLVTWPEDVLYHEGRFVGYIMPEVRGAKSIISVCRGGAQAEAVIPEFDWRSSLLVAKNLAKVVKALHDRDIVIGDMNSNNVSVYPNGDVVIMDVDSFDVRTSTGEHYKCKVATAPYLAPELQGKSLSSEDALFTKQSDDFALAIHIFQLFTGNYHPFSVRLLDTSVSSELSEQDFNIARGNCPFVKGVPGCTIPVGAPDIYRLLPRGIASDLEATLRYQLTPGSANYYPVLTESIMNRTTAERWLNDLSAFYEQRNSLLQRCAKNPRHYHPVNGECELCAAENRRNAVQPVKKPVPPPPQPRPSANTAPAASASSPATAAGTAGTASTAAAKSAPAPSAASASAQPQKKRDWLLIMSGICGLMSVIRIFCAIAENEYLGELFFGKMLLLACLPVGLLLRRKKLLTFSALAMIAFFLLLMFTTPGASKYIYIVTMENAAEVRLVDILYTEPGPFFADVIFTVALLFLSFADVPGIGAVVLSGIGAGLNVLSNIERLAPTIFMEGTVNPILLWALMQILLVAAAIRARTNSDPLFR